MVIQFILWNQLHFECLLCIKYSKDKIAVNLTGSSFKASGPRSKKNSILRVHQNSCPKSIARKRVSPSVTSWRPWCFPFSYLAWSEKLSLPPPHTDDVTPWTQNSTLEHSCQRGCQSNTQSQLDGKQGSISSESSCRESRPTGATCYMSKPAPLLAAQQQNSINIHS